MCGIVGYLGESNALPYLLEGLGRLEYRGYDSAGVAVLDNGEIHNRKSLGRVAKLAAQVENNPLSGSPGISHTRWATHGRVTEENAHPHFDASGRLALVHNGVVENHRELREDLQSRGHVFRSETDSEVLAHLIGELYDTSGEKSREALLSAVQSALKKVRGAYGLAMIHSDTGNFLIGARNGSPLVVGLGGDSKFVASDIGAIADWVEDVIYLEDGHIATLETDGIHISTIAGEVVSCPKMIRSDIKLESNGKDGFPHHMLKEIHEQPETLASTMKGRLSHADGTALFHGLHRTNEQLRELQRIIFTGCGTTLHAAMSGEYVIEELGRIPVECEYASEFRYRNVPMDGHTAVFAMSQSGETADTIAALRESKTKGALTLGICNNVFSTISRESDGGISLRAGPEIGVAATKTFTSQLLVLAMIGLLFGRLRDLSQETGAEVIDALESLPALVAKTLELEPEIRVLAEKYAQAGNFLFMGRQANHPVALEAALKLKEITYIPASGHPSGELKHGVIALINEETPSIFIAPRDAVFEKNLSNIEEVKARRGPVIGIGTEGDTELVDVCDDAILVPETPDFLTPIINIIPLQLFAYHVAVILGCDVDKPRNLAKSVTVE